jgi:hypothetical protein
MPEATGNDWSSAANASSAHPADQWYSPTSIDALSCALMKLQTEAIVFREAATSPVVERFQIAYDQLAYNY